MILQASPSTIVGGCSPPVWLVPMIVRTASESEQSDALTAKPSIAELSKRGSSTFEVRGIARTRPLASSRGNVSVRFVNGYCRANSSALSSDTPHSMIWQTPPR